jgi:hypothetical protein
MKKRALLTVGVFLGITTILCAQQKYRREHLICSIDGGRMDWTGQQKGGINDASCEFAHDAVVDGKMVKHKAWASCTEIR